MADAGGQKPKASCRKRGRKKLATPVRNELKRKRDDHWKSSRIYLGKFKERWTKLKMKYKFSSDQDFAEFLLDRLVPRGLYTYSRYILLKIDRLSVRLNS